MLHDTTIKGLTTELQCQLSFTKLGYNVSVPLSSDCRYDFIADINGILLRVQSKTCKETETLSGIKFSVKSSHLSSSGNVSYSYKKEDIDAFATFYNNQCYLIPIEDCGSSLKTLLFKKDNNNQSGDLLEDFELEKIISKITINDDIKEKILLNNNIRFKKKVFKVHQYSLDNEYLNTYESFSEASKSIGVNRGGPHISEAARGKRKTAYGFLWKVTEEEE